MNFRKLCKIACVFIFLISIQGNALAATIHGTIYEWYSFKPLENSIVEINSTPEQYFVATNAEYSFNLTPGTYLITANYLEENTVIYTAEEEVIITDEGEYVHDLLLFPTYQEDLLYQEEFENVNLDFEETEPQSQVNSQNTVLTFALLALCILVLAGYLVKKEKRNSPEKEPDIPGGTLNLNSSIPNSSIPDTLELNNSEPVNFTTGANMSGYIEPGEAVPIEKIPETDHELSVPSTEGLITDGLMLNTQTAVQEELKLPENSKTSINSLAEEITDSFNSEDSEGPEASLPDDLKEIMGLIRANGNRITQRELRKKSPYSESKVSLMLSDLEERGLVEKFKRGRGNIIRIPDGEALKQAGFNEKKA